MIRNGRVIAARLAVCASLAISLLALPNTAHGRNDSRAISQALSLGPAGGLRIGNVYLPEMIGPEVRPAEYSWQIGLVRQWRGKTWRCGGVLITRQYVLTAAHCVDLAKPEDVGTLVPASLAEMSVFGATDRFGQLPLAFDAQFGIRIHRGYKQPDSRGKLIAYRYDAALLRLAKPVAGATPAPVRRTPVAPDTVPRAIASGWGDYSDGTTGTLRAASVPLADTEACRREAIAQVQPSLTDLTLCTLDPVVDACARDSGGPLVIGSRRAPQTIGIVSFGSAQSCGVPYPGRQLVGGYTRASSLADWIVEQTGDRKAVTSADPEQLMDVSTFGGVLK